MSQAVRVLMEFQERWAERSCWSYWSLAQLVSLEIRVKVVPLDFQV